MGLVIGAIESEVAQRLELLVYANLDEGMLDRLADAPGDPDGPDARA